MAWVINSRSILRADKAAQLMNKDIIHTQEVLMAFISIPLVLPIP